MNPQVTTDSELALLPQGNHTSRFHSNPDILGEIFEYLTYDNDLDSTEAAQSRQNLSWVALTCRAFLEPALDRLWRYLDTLYPLFKILPAFIQTDGTHVLRGCITREQWDRFDWYARRVKRFCYTRDPDNLDIAMHVYFRIAQLRTTPLLPSLRHLHCPSISQNDFLISGVCLFLSPSLQSIEFCDITSVEDKLSGTFLHTLLCDGASLESIVFRGCGLSRGTLDLILQFEQLRCLELAGMGPALELQWLQKVGALPKLDDLAIDFTNSLIEPLKEDIGFRDLKSLMITAPLSFIRAFLPRISTPHLETFVSVSPADLSVDRNTFLTDIVARWSTSLRRFALVHQHVDETTEELQMASLAPLFPLRNLESFRVEGYVMELTDDDISQLASSWPAMTTFLLPYLTADRHRPSIKALRTLSDRCPRLTHLRIPLDAVEVPPFVSQGSAPRPHGLQILTIATSDDDDTWEIKNQIHLARHIDNLFPRLKYLMPFEGHEDDRWVQVHEMIQMIQTIRTETVQIIKNVLDS